MTEEITEKPKKTIYNVIGHKPGSLEVKYQEEPTKQNVGKHPEKFKAITGLANAGTNQRSR